MPLVVTREFITLQGHPATPLTEANFQSFVRILEGYAQRLETRVEALQDAVQSLEARVTALEP